MKPAFRRSPQAEAQGMRGAQSINDNSQVQEGLVLVSYRACRYNGHTRADRRICALKREDMSVYAQFMNSRTVLSITGPSGPGSEPCPVSSSLRNKRLI